MLGREESHQRLHLRSRWCQAHLVLKLEMLQIGAALFPPVVLLGMGKQTREGLVEQIALKKI